MDAFEKQAAIIKANPTGYRELSRQVCECSRQRNITAVLYVGQDGRRWLWTPSGRGPSNGPGEDSSSPIVPARHLPRAVPIPRQPGDMSYPALAICPRCRTGLLLLPRLDRIDAIALGAATWGRVVE